MVCYYLNVHFQGQTVKVPVFIVVYLQSTEQFLIWFKKSVSQHVIIQNSAIAVSVQQLSATHMWVHACVSGPNKFADFNGNNNSFQLTTKPVLFPVSFHETSSISNIRRRRMTVCMSMNIKGRLKSIVQVIALFNLAPAKAWSRSQWPGGLRRSSAAARLLRLWVRILARAWTSVCCECCVFSGRGICDGLITLPEESYRLWCVVVCHLESSWMRRLWPTGGCRAYWRIGRNDKIRSRTLNLRVEIQTWDISEYEVPNNHLWHSVFNNIV